MVTTATLAFGAATVPQAAVAAEDPPGATDAWTSSTPEGYYRFTAPQAVVDELVGERPEVVELQGNIGPNGTWSDLAMDPSGDDYTTMFGPVEPGLYHYQYVATLEDRTKVAFREPTSPVVVRGEPTWNTLFVPGPSVAWMADVADGGDVEELTYRSAATGERRSAIVWTHPEYDGEPGRRGGAGHRHGKGHGHGPGKGHGKPVPVLYLLADEGQGVDEWTALGRAPQVLDNLAAAGELEPVVVVMAALDDVDPRKELLRSLVPAVEREYRVARDGRHRAVAGIGTGADLALDLTVRHPGRFGSVGAFSGELGTRISRHTAKRVNARTDLLRLYVGNVLDPAYNGTERTLRALERAGVRHEFDGVNPEQGGTWGTWRESLRDFAGRVFDRRSDPRPSDGHLPLEEPYVAPAPGSITTPHVDGNGIVTFETGTQWADASDVTVWANWAPNGAWFRVPMTKVGDRWRVAVGPLDGFYYYRYVVDGVDEKDPADTVNTLTGVSPLFVPGETDHLLADAPTEERGDLSVLSYDSAVAGEERSAYVWTPVDYDAERAEPYPLLVLNHGGGQSWGDWVEVGRAPQILDNLYAEGAIEPMVVVMPNGNVPDFQAEVFEELLPEVEADLHVSTDPADRAMAGLSLGAMNTLDTWLTRPGEFAWVGAFSGFVFTQPEIDADAVNAGTELALIHTGDVSDFTHDFTMSLMAMLDEHGVEYEFPGVTTGPHGFDTWQLNLIDMLPRLFTDDATGEVDAVS